jgi:hypothetical protein
LPSDFTVDLIRVGTDSVDDKGITTSRVYGDIGVNGQNIGRFYENPDTKIAAGTYSGSLRYYSDHNFVQSKCGVLARDGDFLLEISGVSDAKGGARSNILIHPGMLPSHSAGCILAGARTRDPSGALLPLDDQSPLKKLRRMFYGTDDPLSCPNRRIVMHVVDPT